MTKTEYLEQLNHKLRVLPYSERRDALEYYDGYISDGNGEENAMAQLGSPSEVAAMILANYVAKGPAAAEGETVHTPASHKKGFKTAWVIILAFFAVPVGLPLVLAVGVTALALFITLAALVFALGASSVAVLVAGLVGMLALPFVLVQDIGSGLMLAGMVFTLVGLGILFVRVAHRFMGGFTWIARFVSEKIIRRERHGRPAAIQ
jgi:uncharacterized membrane protein